MKANKGLMALFILCACGGPQTDLPLQTDVQSFFADCKKYGDPSSYLLCESGKKRQIEIKFVDSLPIHGIKGMCSTEVVGTSEILILKSNWGESQLKATIYHELGHCILGYKHIGENSEGIMFPRVRPEDYWKKNIVRLIPELFNNSCPDKNPFMCRISR